HGKDESERVGLSMSEPNTRPPIRLRRTHRIALAILAVQALLLADAALSDSPSMDEPVHVTRGLAFWVAGDTRLSVAHPPLANALQGIPGVLMGAGELDWMELQGWEQSDNTRVAGEYMRA